MGEGEIPSPINFMLKNFKNNIIKYLGGYTQKEYTRMTERYQALLDSKTTDTVSKICNEHIFRTLNTLDGYAKSELYGKPSTEWARKMYNVIHNNVLRMLIRYIATKSTVIYRFDKTLDSDKCFEKILKEDGNNIDPEEFLKKENENHQ